MDFSDELNHYTIKIKSASTAQTSATGAEGVDFLAAERFLSANPDLFYQTVFKDGAITSIELDPLYRAYTAAGKTPPAGLQRYAILTAYHKNSGNIPEGSPYAAVTVRGGFSDCKTPEIAFRSMELGGYAEPITVTVTGPQDYTVTNHTNGFMVEHAEREQLQGAYPAAHLTLTPLPPSLAYPAPKHPVPARLDFLRPDGAAETHAFLDGKSIDLATAAACAKWVTKDLAIDDISELPSAAICPWQQAAEHPIQRLK